MLPKKSWLKQVTGDKSSLTGLAGLIMSLVAAGGLIWSMVTYTLENTNRDKVQEGAYDSIKQSLDKFSNDTVDDLKRISENTQKITDTVYELQVKVGVMEKVIDQLEQTASLYRVLLQRSSRAAMAAPSPPAELKAEKTEVKDFSEVRLEAQAPASNLAN